VETTAADAANKQRPKGILLPAAILLAIVGACVAFNALDRSAEVDIDLPEVVIRQAELGPLVDGYHPLLLTTNQGDTEYRYSPAPGAHRGAILVTGADGGFASHAKDLYTRLCEDLPSEDIACLRVRYRNIDDPEGCILDVVAGIRYLEDEGVDSMALVGHSRGGMIVIYTAAAVPEVRTVVTLATEGVREGLVRRLGSRCSILLIHAKNDATIPYRTSEDLYVAAREPKRIVLYPGGNHSLDPVGDKVHEEVHTWILQQLEEP
jgi:pimeloyl-ACP methyl ester carboxylesterase